MDVITGEFRDLASCSAMSLSRSGSLAFIAGRRAYGLVDLDRPQELLKKVVRKSKYDVSEVQFSSGRDTLVAVASNDKIELLDWKQGGESVCEGILKAHTRVVTDLSWNRQQTNLLASGSIDNFIYVWDMKDLRSPAFTLPAVTGASQVCWERTSGNYLATAHEGEIKLWDIRKANTPATYINAHISKIYSLDFSPHGADQLVSSSADNSVKLWNVLRPRQPDNIIKVPRAPVWKVRYTPFGDGLVTLVLNTLVRRENNLMLWNTHNLMSPVHTFYGHTDMVLEFGWRNCDPAVNRHDYQLVTWSKDTSMKLWPISGNLKTMCGEEEANLQDQDQNQNRNDGDNEQVDADEVGSLSSLPRPVSTNSSEGEDSGFASAARRDLMTSSYDSNLGQLTTDPESLTLALDDDETLAGTSSEEPFSLSAQEFAAGTTTAATPSIKSSKQPSNLKQEFKLINFGERLVLEVLDFVERYCVVMTETTKHTIYLNVKFPELYPLKEAPVFSFMTGTTLDQNRGYHLLRKLRLTAQKQVAKNRRCLEMCLRQFEQDIDAMHQEEQEELTSADFVGPVGMGSFQDSNVPYPRTSGARFCGTGQLVCFGWSYTVKFASIANPIVSSRAMKTPRAFSAVSSGQLGQLGGTTPPQFIPIRQRSSRVRFGTKSRISSTGLSISEDVKGLNFPASAGRTVSESDHKGQETEESRGTVTIYDVLPLWPFSTELAQKYIVLGDDPEHTCRYNASVALAAGYKEIAQAWAMAAASCSVAPNNNKASTALRRRDHSDLSLYGRCSVDPHPWNNHPLGRPLLLSLVQHFSRCDIQTTAMLCCVFSYPGCLNNSLKRTDKKSVDSIGSGRLLSPGSGTSSIIGTGRKKNSKSECSLAEDSDVEAALSVVRQNPESQSLEDLTRYSWSESKKPFDPNYGLNVNSDSCFLPDCHKFILDPAQTDIYDCFMKAYAELLSRLGLLTKSTEVNKCISARARWNDPEKNNLGTMLVTRECLECRRPLFSKWDKPTSKTATSNSKATSLPTPTTSSLLRRSCKKRPVCALCNLPVEGLTSICMHCGHGGHSVHMKDWFGSHNECATGCGCPCPALV